MYVCIIKTLASARIANRRCGGRCGLSDLKGSDRIVMCNVTSGSQMGDGKFIDYVCTVIPVYNDALFGDIGL